MTWVMVLVLLGAPTLAVGLVGVGVRREVRGARDSLAASLDRLDASLDALAGSVGVLRTRLEDES